MKKATSRKVSTKAGKGELEKKIMASLRSSERLTAKGKTTKKATPKKSAKKSPSGKSKTGITAKATGKTLKVKMKQKQAQKMTVTKKVLKPLKSGKAVTERKTEKKSGVKVAGKTKVRKAAKKILPETVVKPERKVPQKKVKAVEIPKLVKKSLQRPKAKPATKTTEVRGVRKVRKVGAGRRVRKVEKTEKTIKEIKAVELTKRRGKVKKAEEVTRIKVREAGESHPSVESKYPPTPWEALPAEYGENGITLMVVDPHKLFTFWEIREDALKIFKGKPAVRLYDVTGIDFEKVEANSFADVAVTERIGKEYIHAEPQKEYIADIGIIYDGIFITIARSQKVSTPREAVPEEALPSCQIYESGLRIGY